MLFLISALVTFRIRTKIPRMLNLLLGCGKFDVTPDQPLHPGYVARKVTPSSVGNIVNNFGEGVG